MKITKLLSVALEKVETEILKKVETKSQEALAKITSLSNELESLKEKYLTENQRIGLEHFMINS